MRTKTQLQSSPESSSSARRFVRRSLAQMPSELIEAAELLTSELVTNAAIHSHSPIEVEIDLDLDSLKISVSDDSGQLPIATQAGHMDEHGRGLAIVGSLAEEWGATKRSKGKTVWITMKLPSAKA
jgi:anti-sigma regulatory factor (Ser/Thr protein kinase)